MSKAREVKAFLIEMSTLPSQAPSILTCETRFPPASQTAMFIGCPIWAAFFSAAAMTRRASSRFTDMCGLLPPSPATDSSRFRGSLTEVPPHYLKQGPDRRGEAMPKALESRAMTPEEAGVKCTRVRHDVVRRTKPSTAALSSRDHPASGGRA